MVESYRENCQYLLGLDNYIYLFPYDDTRIVADDERIYSIIGDCYELEVKTAEMRSEARAENQTRYKFNNELNVTVMPNASTPFSYELKRLTGEKWLVVSKDKNGNYFLINRDFEARVTYERTLTSNSTEFNRISIRFSLDSNFPITMVEVFNNNTSNFSYQVCANPEYIKSIYMIERGKANVDVLGTDSYYFSRIVTWYGTLDFAQIEPNEGSFTLTETYDGDQYLYQAQFTTNYTDYKSGFKDRLIEYTDNKYEFVLTTMYRTYAIFRDFTVYYDTNTEEESITNTFIFSGVSNIPLAYNDGDFEDLVVSSENVTFAPVDDFKYGLTLFHTKECVGFNTGYARYLLVEVMENYKRTNRYFVHEDWADYFSHSGREIVGTFNDDTVLDGLGSVVFPDSSCSLDIVLCNFTKRPQGRYDFNDKYTTDTFTVSSTCDWKITSIPDWITISRTQGEADEEYELKITAKKQDVYTESYFNLINDNVIIRVIVTYTPISQIKDCNWLESTETDIIEAEETTVRMYLNWQAMQDYNIDAYMIGFEGETEDEVVSFMVMGEDSFMFKFSRYNGDDDHQIILNLNINGFPESACTLVFERKARETIKVRAEGTICENGNSYLKYGVYYRYCSGCEAEFSHYEKGELYKENDPECGANVYYRWVEAENEGICEYGTLYQMEKQEMSYDMVEWTETGVYRKGRVLRDTSNICSGEVPAYDEWRETGETICNGTTLYMTEDHYYSNDGILWAVMPQERRMGRVIEEDSAECGYLPPIEPKYKYVEVKDEYICEYEQEPMYRFVEDEDNYICEEEDDCDLIEGETRWVEVPNEYLCDGHTKTKKLQQEKVVNCEWVKQEVYKSGDVIETNSKDCGYFEPIYDWEKVDGYICDYGDYSILYSTNELENTSSPFKINLNSTEIYTQPNKVNELVTFDVEVKISTLNSFCYEITNLTSIEFVGKWDNTNVTNLTSMFLGCKNLETIKGLENFNTEKVTHTTSMFFDCESLKELDLSFLRTDKVRYVLSMFAGCINLERLDLTNFDITNVTSMDYMFSHCTSLNYIKCTQAFKDWCEVNKDEIRLDNFDTITWDIV